MLAQARTVVNSIGNSMEQKRLLDHTLKLEREWGNDAEVVVVLCYLSDANRMLGFFKEGISQVEEALEIYERIGDVGDQGQCLLRLALLLLENEQLDAAEEAASRAIKILPEKGQEYRACGAHRTLGAIYHSKGEQEKAIHHFETALTIASPFGWNGELFWTHNSLAGLFRDEDDFDNAHLHIQQAKTYAVDDRYQLGRTIILQAQIYYQQNRPEDSTLEALRALEIFEGLGAQEYVKVCKDLLQDIEQATESRATSGN